MEPTACPETSVTNYHYSLRNNPEERSSQLLRGGSLQSRIHYIVFKKKSIEKRLWICDFSVYKLITTYWPHDSYVKWSMLCLKSIVRDSNINTLKSICSHSIIKYGIILGGNSSNSGNIFASQNKIVRIMTDEQPRTSGRSLLNNWGFNLLHASIYFH